MARRYDSRTTIFSPEGRLYQVEYAMEAISNAGAAIGMLCKDGVVLVAEKKITSKLLDTHAVGVRREKMYKLDDHVCCAVAGITGVDEGFANARQGHLPCSCLCYCWSQHRHSSVMLKVLAAASSCKQLSAAAQQQLDSWTAPAKRMCIHGAAFKVPYSPFTITLVRNAFMFHLSGNASAPMLCRLLHSVRHMPLSTSFPAWAAHVACYAQQLSDLP
jgi:hypothetical protein